MSLPTVSQSAAAQLHHRCTTVLEARIPVHLERLTWSRDRIRAHQTAELRSLLRYVLPRSHFYAEWFGAIDPAGFEIEDLRNLPTVTKVEMLDAFDALVTEPDLTRDLVEKHLTTISDEPIPLRDDYVVLTSGGSSGTRGVYVWEADSLADHLLGMLRPSIAALYALGGPPADPIPYVRIAAPSAVHATRMLSKLFTGTLFDVTVLSATAPIPALVAAIDRVQPAVLGGYPSVLVQLAEEKHRGRLTASPWAIAGGSEPFTADMKARVRDAFGVEPSDAFGSTEGLFGFSEPGAWAIALATDLAIVELVDDDNQPVAAGQRSSKVLLTSLLNRTQPLIRYELTDAMRRVEPAADHGYPRVEVDGRSDDVLTWGGTTVHPIAIRSALLHHRSVIEYQVRQTAGGVDLDIVAPDGCEPEPVAVSVRNALLAAGLSNPSVDVRVVPAIDRSPATGKARRFIPLPSTPPT